MRSSVQYSSKGYRRNIWFTKRVKQYVSLQSDIKLLKERRYLLDYIHNNIINSNIINVPSTAPSMEKANFAISSQGVNKNILYTNFAGKQHSMKRHYTKFSDTVTSYTLYDEYDASSDSIVFYMPTDLILKEVDKQINSLDTCIFGIMKKARLLRKDVLRELAVKQQALSLYREEVKW